MKDLLHLITILSLLIWISCKKDNGKEDEPPPCPDDDIFNLIPTYEDPVWHPSGEVIGFNYTPIKSITYTYGFHCPQHAEYEIIEDSIGFYLVNADGSNQRRVLPYFLLTPAWNPDGEWIAFSDLSGTIYKMPFDGESFDTTSIIQLTFDGRFWDVAWSDDGQKIAYNNRIGNPAGVWLGSAFDPSVSEFFASLGGYPDWIGSDSIIYIDTAGLWVESIDHVTRRLINDLNENSIHGRGYTKVSHLLQKVAILAGLSNEPSRNLWTVNYDGMVLQMIKEGVFQFDWGANGKIVYQNFNYSRLDEEQGTLWTMNADGSNPHQLTYHQDLEIIIPDEIIVLE